MKAYDYLDKKKIWFTGVYEDGTVKHHFICDLMDEYAQAQTVMHRCIAYEDIDRCFDTLFAYIEKKEPWFKREQYIAYATMIAETIDMEKKLNGA